MIELDITYCNVKVKAISLNFVVLRSHTEERHVSHAIVLSQKAAIPKKAMFHMTLHGLMIEGSL